MSHNVERRQNFEEKKAKLSVNQVKIMRLKVTFSRLKGLNLDTKKDKIMKAAKILIK